MEASLMLLGEGTALETGAWLASLLQWLTCGAATVLVVGVISVGYETLKEYRGSARRVRCGVDG